MTLPTTNLCSWNCPVRFREAVLELGDSAVLEREVDPGRLRKIRCLVGDVNDRVIALVFLLQKGTIHQGEI